jgi:Outer membrane protein and related peptidoglycan-associated (lipo)proteins
MVQSTAALTGAAIDSSLAAGRLVVSGLQLEDAGHPSADAERLIRQLATALRENQSARFRLVATVDPSGDAVADQAISDAYSRLVWAMLVGAGASPDRLIPGGNSPTLNAAGEPAKEGGAPSMAKAAAEELVPGAKLVKLGIRALANRHAAQTHADSLGLRRLARLDLVRMD